MKDDFPFAIYCPSCGTFISRSLRGTRTHTKCPKCQAGLFYEVGDSGPTIKITKEPKSPPEVPAVPA